MIAYTSISKNFGEVQALQTVSFTVGEGEVFGLLGLIVGPVIAAVALAVLRTYDREVCAPLASDEAISAPSRPAFAPVP